MPLLSATGTWIFVILLLAALALASIAVHRRQAEKSARALWIPLGPPRRASRSSARPVRPPRATARSARAASPVEASPNRVGVDPRPAPANVLAEGRRRIERRYDDDLRRPRLVQTARSTATPDGRADAGHGRVDRRGAASQSEASARHRARHGLHGGMARRGSDDRASGRRRARAPILEVAKASAPVNRDILKNPNQ